MPTRMTILSLCWVLGLGVLTMAPPPAAAQQAQQQEPALKIAILDLDMIRREAAVVKSIRAQIDEFRKGFQADIQKEENALRSANQELAKKRTLLAPDAFAKERRQFEQKVIGVQKLVQKRKIELDRAQTKAMIEVEKKLNGIIAGIANKQGISVVMRRRQTILVARSLDITGEVLNRLNAELKTVTVAKPGTK